MREALGRLEARLAIIETMLQTRLRDWVLSHTRVAHRTRAAESLDTRPYCPARGLPTGVGRPAVSYAWYAARSRFSSSCFGNMT